MASKRVAHVLATHATACGGADHPARCPWDDGGLASCMVCGLAEGSLTTDCPETRATIIDEVYAGRLDFVGGRWVTPRPRGKRAPLETAEVVARELGLAIVDGLPKGWGFCLTLATFGEEADRRMTYLSNIDRVDTVKMIRELADKIERAEREV